MISVSQVLERGKDQNLIAVIDSSGCCSLIEDL
jgi:hypothetical protein